MKEPYEQAKEKIMDKLLVNVDFSFVYKVFHRKKVKQFCADYKENILKDPEFIYDLMSFDINFDLIKIGLDISQDFNIFKNIYTEMLKRHKTFDKKSVQWDLEYTYTNHANCLSQKLISDIANYAFETNDDILMDFCLKMSDKYGYVLSNELKLLFVTATL